MTRLAAPLLMLLLTASCASQHRHLYVYYGAMDEPVETDHVQYRDGVLIIDNENIELPVGETLSIKYRYNDDIASYRVKVDGKMVAEKERVHPADH